MLLEDTRAAFDSVAVDYDGPRGNNDLIQDMRHEMWRWLDATFAAPSHVMDLGCGTGLDAVRMAQLGHHVTAIDWSPRMVERTRARATEAQVSDRVQTAALGAHQLERVEGNALYDGAYSDLGALNCVPDLTAAAHELSRLLRPRGRLVFTVIGRWCPWEIGYYAARRDWSRVRVRFGRRMMAVRMNGHTVWTKYWTPAELYREFSREFSLVHHRALCLFAPPPYMTSLRDRHPGCYQRLWRWDRRLAGWPGLRRLGDHFLIVMEKR
ncbi:MAG: methyltransferase domain-containing protein [Steroidobacteraceae bacterium]